MNATQLRFTRPSLGFIRLHPQENPDILNKLKVSNTTENVKLYKKKSLLDHLEGIDRA
jgi:hypothetical protein